MAIKTSRTNIGSRKTILTSSNGKKEPKREQLITRKDKLRKQNTRRETNREKSKINSEHIWDKLSL